MGRELAEPQKQPTDASFHARLCDRDHNFFSAPLVTKRAVLEHPRLSSTVQAERGQIYRNRSMERPLLPHDVAWEASRSSMS